ncbi:MAG TPA: histidine phosphatase family protein [Gemmatimonadales bacterium]|jgi:phosphohistidine phosphatase
MHLILIRHADAGDRNPGLWPDDTLRPLTDKGRRRHRRVAKRLKRRGLVPELLLTSPWLRAWQTAQIVANDTGGPAPVACPALATAPSLPALQQAVAQASVDARVALVGHEPWLSELASLLLAGDPHRLSIDVPKSGVLGLECESLAPGTATLGFLWRPKGS